MNTVDPILFELIKNNIDTIVDEMTLTMVRTAYSPGLRDVMDFSTAVCDAEGRMVAQGTCVALHLGSIPDAIAAVRRKFASSTEPGDLFIMNDPYTGGMHLPDVFFFKPVFFDGVLLAYLVFVGHQIDIGGRVPGSMSVEATEVFQEGLHIPPLKLYSAGRPVTAIWELIAQNVRVPDKAIGDLQGSLAALFAAEKLLRATVANFGLVLVRDYFGQVLEYSERITRGRIAEIPVGHYEFSDYMDDAGTIDEPVKIKVALDVVGDELCFDFAGSSPQLPAGINSTLSFTKSGVYAAVRCLMPRDLPTNEGFFRPIKVSAPLGSIVNPREPAAVSQRGVTGFRVVDAVFGALSQALPDHFPAAGEGGINSFHFGGYDQQSGPFSFGDSPGGTRGGGRTTTELMVVRTFLATRRMCQPSSSRRTPQSG